MFGAKTKTSTEIRNKSLEESIRLLSLQIDGLKAGDTDAQTRLYLQRSYHNYRLATDSALNAALQDVFTAIDLDGNRFQIYLLGALILFVMKQWDESLKMFELSIRLNADLFQLLANKLIFLKFKILTQKGFDEELSLKNAMTYRYLSECIENMSVASEDNFHSYIQQFISVKPKDCNSYLSEYLNRMTKNHNSDRNTPQTFDSFVSKLFSSGDQKTVRINEVQSKPIGCSIAPKFESPDQQRQSAEEDSVDLEFKEILSTEKVEEKDNLTRRDTIQTWIDNNFRSDTVSKLCSFEETIEEPVKESVATAQTSQTVSSVNVIPDNCSVTSRHSSNEFKNNRSLQPATNLLKLRGVYIGNLKPNCDHKKLKDIFKAYGTIVEMYQPSGADYAFIHFKIHESATNMLNEWKHRHIDQCKDGKPLVVRFTASQEQMKKFNSLSYSDYKKRCNEFHECERWRSGQHCPYDRDCPYKHLYINRAVDTLPDKRKVNWKCI